MSNELANRIQRVKPSPTLALSARAQELKAQGKDIISLSVGEPDFDTPEHIKDAARQAIAEGKTKYTPVDGTPELKQAVANKFVRDNQLRYESNQILVSTGAKQGLYNAMQAILNPGDEIIIPTPYWVSYPDMALLAEAEPVFIRTGIEQRFKINADQLASAITAETRMVIFNSPSNPSGMCYSLDELKALGEVLQEHPNIIILSDDIYEHCIWPESNFCNFVTACPELYDRTININGVSKAYAMTGWRIGYAAGPQKIIGAMKKIQSQSTSNPNSIAQAAATAALNGDQSCIQTMVKAFKERHDYFIDALNQLDGVECKPCDGTFYAFANMQRLIDKCPDINDDMQLTEYLINEAGIVPVPGSAFGNPGYMRFSFATSMEQLKAAIDRMSKAIQSIAQKA